MSDPIRVIPGYLTPGECAELAAVGAEVAQYADWSGNGGRSTGVWHEQVARKIPAWFLGRMAPLTPPGESIETLKLSEMVLGDFHVIHRDNQFVEVHKGYWLKGEPNHSPNRTGTAIVYLTECEGGEIYFPELHEVYRPRPGLAVAFGAHITHGVFKVLGGVRRAITIWYVKA